MSPPLRLVAPLLTAGLLTASTVQAQCTKSADCPAGLVCRGEGSCARADPPAGGATSPETTAEACRDGVDDDGDGEVDCSDSDCRAFVFCTTPSEPAPAETAGPPVIGEIPGDVTVRKESGHGFNPIHLVGPAFLVAGYAGAIVSGAIVSDGKKRSREIMTGSLIPVAGPWMLIADGGLVDEYTAQYTVFGALQGVGVVLSVISIGVLVSGSGKTSALSAQTAVGTLTVWPELGPTQAGVSVRLRDF